MRIVGFPSENQEVIRQAASLLVVAFKEHSPNAWPDLDAALEEIH